MRWVVRILVFWAVTAPLFYLFGLPVLMEMLSKKAQAEAFAQCGTQLRASGTVGGANALLTQDQAEKYCHCMSDRLILTKNDLVDIVQKKPPAGLTALANSLAEGCNAKLKQDMGLIPATSPTDSDGMTPL